MQSTHQDLTCWFQGPIYTQSPGKMQKEDPLSDSIIYTIGAYDSRIGGCMFWVLPGLWILFPKNNIMATPKIMSFVASLCLCERRSIVLASPKDMNIT